ncbi:MAG: ABC-2 family transporter protein, partial [Verrucomicrobia bacterium]|nr:ABC-2 family transporter protein [Verrucomicrobiota bacterium]
MARVSAWLNRGWGMSVFTMELRQILSYRMDFWLQFGGSLIAQFGVAWFLWAAIFRHQGVERIGMFSFPALILYYLMAPVMLKLIQGQEMGNISTEIYEGSLNRYLVYPVSYFRFKLTTSAAHSLVYAVQFILMAMLFTLFVGIPDPFCISPVSVLQSMLALLGAAYLHFVIVATIELTAFWADNVWSLVVIVRFATGLLGGAMIPLSLFPEWSQDMLLLMPFAYFVSFPLTCFLGLEGSASWINGMTVITFWSTCTTLIYAYVWSRGRYRYTG